MYKNSVFRVLPQPLFILLIPVVHKSQMTRLDTMVSNICGLWMQNFLSGTWNFWVVP